MRIYDGKVFFKFESSPWYTSGVSDELKKDGYVRNIALKYWKIPFCKMYLAKRQYVKEISKDFKSKVCAAAVLYWGTKNIEIITPSTTHIIVLNGDTTESITYYEEVFGIINKLKLPVFTRNPQVIFDYDTEKYYGYSHRGCCGFGLGDMLFSPEITPKRIETFYYANRKYRKAFVKALKEYVKEDDSYLFKSLVEGGIMDVVPFKEKGTKIIETYDEAFEAASNFANYIS